MAYALLREFTQVEPEIEYDFEYLEKIQKQIHDEFRKNKASLLNNLTAEEIANIKFVGSKA